MAEAQRQKQYYDQKIGAMNLKPGDLVLGEGWCLSGKEEIKDWWEDEPHKVVHQIAMDIPLHKVMDQHGQSHILDCNWLLLVISETGIPLCMGVCQAWDRCTQFHPS